MPCQICVTKHTVQAASRTMRGGQRCSELSGALTTTVVPGVHRRGPTVTAIIAGCT